MHYEIRAMRIGELLDTSFCLLKRRFGLLIGLQVCAIVPGVCLNFATAPLVLSATPGADDTTTSPTLPAVLLLLVARLLIYLLQVTVMLAVTRVVAEHYRGVSMGFGTALGAGLRQAPRLIGTLMLFWIPFSLGFAVVGMVGISAGSAVLAAVGDGTAIVFLLIAIGTIGLLAPLIYFALHTVLLLPLAVLERTFFAAAWSRCFALMKSHRLRACGVYALPVVTSLVFQGQLLIFVHPPLAETFGLGGVGYALRIATQTLVALYVSVLTVLFYFDLRCRKEGYDLAQLTEAVAGRAEAR